MHSTRLCRQLAFIAPLLTGSLAFAQGNICDGEGARNGSGVSHKSCASAAQATTPDRSQFLGRLEADYYRIRSASGGARANSAVYIADNPRQRLSLEFDTVGLAIGPLNRRAVRGVDTFRLSTLSLDEHPLSAAQTRASGNRLERQHAGIVEWYRNSPSDSHRVAKGVSGYAIGCGQFRHLSPGIGASLVLRKYVSRPFAIILPRSVDHQYAANSVRILMQSRRRQRWGPVSELQNPDAAAGVAFGISVAVSGNTVVVGAGGHRTGEDGAAYIFLRNQGGTNAFGQVAKLAAKDGAPQDAFADSIAIDCDTVVAGAAARKSNTGASYIFSRNQGGLNAWAR